MAVNESDPMILEHRRAPDRGRPGLSSASPGTRRMAVVVHYEAPETGATVTKDSAYAEVESVKPSDVIAPLSG